jgi:hypothetical protein
MCVICLRLFLFSTLNYDICQAYNNIDTFKKFKQWLNNFTNDTDYNIYQQLYRLILNYFLYTPFLIHFVFQLHLYILPVSFICWNSHRSSTSNSYWQTYCLNITNGYRLGVMVINATFNNILIISWRSVLLVEEPRVPGENHWPASSHWQMFSHNVLSRTPRPERDSNSQRFIFICTKYVKSTPHKSDKSTIQ